jgi:glutaminyl-tRNA synthetase
VDAEVRLYDHLFTIEDPSDIPEGKDWKEYINRDSLKRLTHCKVEPSLRNARPGDKFQFLRQGYFCADLKDHSPERPVFNRTVTLKDSWSKILQKGVR